MQTYFEVTDSETGGQLKAGIELGECLLEAKKLVPGKQFMAWCRDNFPELCHRTLNRYMKISVNKCETHVSKAGGLRQAYKACSAADRESDSSEATRFQKDAGIIKKNLAKAKTLLNDYPDLISSEDADAICDLVDALNIWASDYRDRTNRRALNKHRDEEFEMSLTDEKQTPTAPESTEIVVVE